MGNSSDAGPEACQSNIRREAGRTWLRLRFLGWPSSPLPREGLGERDLRAADLTELSMDDAGLTPTGPVRKCLDLVTARLKAR